MNSRTEPDVLNFSEKVPPFGTVVRGPGALPSKGNDCTYTDVAQWFFTTAFWAETRPSRALNVTREIFMIVVLFLLQ